MCQDMRDTLASKRDPVLIPELGFLLEVRGIVDLK